MPELNIKVIVHDKKGVVVAKLFSHLKKCALCVRVHFPYFLRQTKKGETRMKISTFEVKYDCAHLFEIWQWVQFMEIHGQRGGHVNTLPLTHLKEHLRSMS